MRQVMATVISNREILPDAWLLEFHAPELARVSQAGQFVHVRCSHSFDVLLRRPFSLHSIQADAGRLGLLYQRLGPASAWLARQHAGDQLDLLGPAGRGWEIDRQTRHALLLGRGVQIAPLLSLAGLALSQGLAVTLLLGAATADQVYPAALLPLEVEYHVATDDGTLGEWTCITQVLPTYVNWADALYICGPQELLREVSRRTERVRERGFAQVALANAPVCCALGTCLSCAVPTRRGLRLLCKDGPVFPLRDVIW